jgi:hypothetical protein
MTEQTEPAAPAAAEQGGTPLPLATFPAAVQRSLDPKSPVPIRIMAAKGILVCGPRDFLSAIYVLTFDSDAKVAETAQATAKSISEKMISGLRDEDLDPAVLSFYARVLGQNDAAIQLIALNPTTPDAALAEIAAIAPDSVVEIISQNQLRILRDERIVRAIVANPRTRASVRDPLLDFCVRSGLHLPDLPEYQAARQRVFGADPVAAEEIKEAEKHTVEAVVAEYGAAVTQETAEVPEAKKLTFTQRMMKMSVAQKIKMASLGNKEARTILLRDSNKLVALAAVSNPRISDSEVLALSNNRTLMLDVMNYILRNRDWLKSYQVKVNLVNNPKTPPANSMKLLQSLHPNELKAVARNKNIPQMVQNQARAQLQKQAAAKG